VETEGNIGIYSPEARKERLREFMAKRLKRSYPNLLVKPVLVELYKKIATMTDIEKKNIVAEALNKPLEKRTGLENLLVYRGRVGNEGKNFLVLFNYFLYINFLINF